MRGRLSEWEGRQVRGRVRERVSGAESELE